MPFQPNTIYSHSHHERYLWDSGELTGWSHSDILTMNSPRPQQYEATVTSTNNSLRSQTMIPLWSNPMNLMWSHNMIPMLPHTMKSLLSHTVNTLWPHSTMSLWSHPERSLWVQPVIQIWVHYNITYVSPLWHRIVRSLWTHIMISLSGKNILCTDLTGDTTVSSTCGNRFSSWRSHRCETFVISHC